MNLEDFKHASADFKRLNPALGGLRRSEPERGAAPALERQSARKAKGVKRTARGGKQLFRVSIISMLRKQRDGDNEQGGLKELRDAIAAWLGCDDVDDVVNWEYDQVITRGQQGTIVKVEVQ